jgi:hypothetical protein
MTLIHIAAIFVTAKLASKTPWSQKMHYVKTSTIENKNINNQPLTKKVPTSAGTF